MKKFLESLKEALECLAVLFAPVIVFIILAMLGIKL